MHLNPDQECRAELVEKVHASPFMVALCVAGGAHRLSDWLFSRPGASRAMVSARIPYTAPQLNRYLGCATPSAVSASTAWQMALQARQEASMHSSGRAPLGIACTAALATLRDRKGAERAQIALATEHRKIQVQVQFEKGRRTREEQEDLLAGACLRLLAAVCSGEPLPELVSGDGVSAVLSEEPCGDALAGLYDGRTRWVTVEPDGLQRANAPPQAGALLPGSFHPLHRGHAGMARAAARVLGTPVDLELSIENADKKTMSLDEVRKRIEGMAWRFRVHVTRAATFLEKARIFPGKTWVLGSDTAVRLVQPAYYGDEAGRDAAFQELALLHARFLVLGRSAEGLFRTLEQVALPDSARGLFDSVPESEFRIDLSSTEIRSRALKPVGDDAPEDAADRG